MPIEKTPILKVSRPVAACSRCRNAKIKCDGKLPACSSCEKNGRAAECTSTNDQFARGKERSYVSTLETRIDRLQAKLEEAKARKPSVVSLPDDDLSSISRRPSHQVSVGDSYPSVPTKASRRREAVAIDDLVADFGFLSVNATTRDFYGFTAVMSYARLVLSACSKDPLPLDVVPPLPPRYAATSLVQHYLSNIFCLLPLFEESAFYASVDSLYARNAQQATPVDHWNVRMVLAIASASKSKQLGDKDYNQGIGHVCAALQHAEAVLHPGSIASVQALVLLTEYAMLDPHHFDSWCSIGAASRAMADLGMHQDPPNGTAMPKIKLEIRRRVYYCVYALDRSTSLVQSRAFSFSDDSAKVKVPFGRHSASANNTPSPSPAPTQKLWLQSHDQAIALIELRKLQSTWYTDLFQSGRSRWEEPYPYIWDKCEGMRKWFETLPSATSQPMRAFFELELLYSYVYLLSPSPRVPVISPFAQKLIFEYCIQYADLMLRLIADPNYTAPLTFYDAMRVYMTGRQFLDVLQHNGDTLLSGHVPSPPEVKPTSAPPPSLPVVPHPPGDNPQNFSVLRSITCIQQITECLSNFGVRWGYMKWNQQYQTETTTMMDQLIARLSSTEELSMHRRQSMWPGHSPGSVGSIGSMGSMSYPGSLAPTTPNYIPAEHSNSIGSAGQTPQQSPPQYLQPMTAYGMTPVPQTLPPQQPGQLQYSARVYNFGQPTQMPVQPPSFNSVFAAHTNPGSQFASWGGYNVTAGAPSTLDEENAMNPPGTQQWYQPNTG